MGNPATAPGLVSIYDVSADCRRPVLQSTAPVARLGHESGFSRDGRTFWATSSGTQSITAVDVSDPRVPYPVWQGKVLSHGMSLNADGTRAYDAGLLGGDPHAVGAARIMDIADETLPRVIANLRLRVNQPAEHAEAANDPGAFSPVQGYAARYCDLPTPRDPLVVACSLIASGLRLFDISDLVRPREIGCYVAPTEPVAENGLQVSSFAMSKPAIVPRRREAEREPDGRPGDPQPPPPTPGSWRPP